MANRRINILLQTIQKQRKSIFMLLILINQSVYSQNIPFSNLSHILCPLLPITAVTNLIHHPRKQHILITLKLQFHLSPKRLTATITRIITTTTAITTTATSRLSNQHIIRFFLIQLNLINHRIKTVIVSSQSIQYRPYHLILVIIIQHRMSLRIRHRHHRNNNITILFASSLSHHSSNRLHNIHLRIPSRQKQNRIQRWHIHTFTQTPRIRQNPTRLRILRHRLQPTQMLIPFRH